VASTVLALADEVIEQRQSLPQRGHHSRADLWIGAQRKLLPKT
jgi:hypothetical protein